MHNQRIYTYLMARYCSRNRDLVKYCQNLPPLPEGETGANMAIAEGVLRKMFKFV